LEQTTSIEIINYRVTCWRLSSLVPATAEGRVSQGWAQMWQCNWTIYSLLCDQQKKRP